MESLKPLLDTRMSALSTSLQQMLMAYAGKPLDMLYSRLGGLNGRFFPAGWGNLGIVNLKEDIDMIRQWPPQGMKIEWKLLQQGMQDGVPFKLYEGTYRTPCINRIYDALPLESRTGRVQLLVPAGPSTAHAAAAAATMLSAPGKQRQGLEDNASSPVFSPKTAPAAVLHLAATGDQGFWRRLRLGGPLIRQGICQLIHESPYYGARRPPEQRGAKLCAVSDLLALGWATIYESLCLLHWLEEQGVTYRGICGLSMGGVHASMTAGLYPLPLAVTPLLAPRSAAVAYCDGALAPLMSWAALLTERDLADNEVEQVVAAASQPVSLLQQARYVVLHNVQQQQLQQQWDANAAAFQQRHDHVSPTMNSSSSSSSSDPAWQGQWSRHGELLQQQMERADAAMAAVQQAAALKAAAQAAAVAAAEERVADSTREQQEQQKQKWEGLAGPETGAQHLYHTSAVPASQGHAAVVGPAADTQQAATAQHRVQVAADTACPMEQPWRQQQEQHQQHHRQAGQPSLIATVSSNSSSSWRRQVWRPKSSPNGAKLAAAAAAAGGEKGRSGLADQPSAETFRRLRHVLETYTDVTRYPPPVRPDAAVLVAARHDGYVSMESVKALQAHWPGSELRLVDGGHVSAFLMHQAAFRTAVRDSLARLAAQPPPPAAPTSAAAAAAAAGCQQQ